VAYIESGYNPYAVGGVGEIGLMQIRPPTATMLGYVGGVTGLFVPEINVRYSVAYLAGAWRLADGDLCRALMKYRAGHGEERMTALSVEYCRRARGYLAAIGSPLGQGAVPNSSTLSGPFAAGKPALLLNAGGSSHHARPPRIRFAATASMARSAGQIRSLAERQSIQRIRKLRGAQFWAAHEARIKTITAKVKASQLRIAAGL
jgi:hypothetical protein